jgi:hypothetical protein
MLLSFVGLVCLRLRPVQVRVVDGKVMLLLPKS